MQKHDDDIERYRKNIMVTDITVVPPSYTISIHIRSRLERANLNVAGCNASGHWPSVGRLESRQAGVVSVGTAESAKPTRPCVLDSCQVRQAGVFSGCLDWDH